MRKPCRTGPRRKGRNSRGCILFGQAGAHLGLEAVMPSAHILVEIFSDSVAGRRSPQSSMRTSASAFLKWVAVLRLDRGGDAATESNGVHGWALAKPLQHGQLRHQHIPFMHRRNGSLGFVVHAFG